MINEMNGKYGESKNIFLNETIKKKTNKIVDGMITVLCKGM